MGRVRTSAAALAGLALVLLSAPLSEPRHVARAADPGVTITQPGGSSVVVEGGVFDAYDLVLDSQPSGTVTINFGHTPSFQIELTPALVVFTTTTWDTPQTVVVTAVDDATLEGSQTVTISHTAIGGGYDSVVVPALVVTVTDDDASVTVTESDGATDLAEAGGEDTYELVLDVIPASTVAITITPDEQATVSPVALIFTTGDWNVPRTVTVTAVNDTIVEGTHPGTIVHEASGGYAGVAIRNVVADVTDDDPAVVFIGVSGGSTIISEDGATDAYTVVLGGEPSGTVVITMAADPQATTSPSILTFTTEEWDTSQSVTVTAVDDAVLEGGHTGTVTHSASGGGYDGASILDLVADVIDNDAGTIVETDGSTAVTEGGATDTYTFVLDSLPSGTVTVTVTPDSQAMTSPATLTFTTVDWSTPQTVTVTAQDDTIVEGGHTSVVAHAGTGGGYDGVAMPSLSVDVIDNDAPGVSIVQSGGSTNVTEAGSSDSYTMVLNSQPSADVFITFGPSPALQVQVTPATLTFNMSTWSIVQTVTVTAVDDSILEGSHTVTISHTPTGGGYDGVAIADVVANITDTVPAVTIAESDGSTDVAEGGAVDEYTIVLGSKPTGSVIISFGVEPLVKVGINPATVLFTSSNWDTPQSVTVTALDDDALEGQHTGTISHSASGGGYDGAAIQEVVANITDNDAGVAITESDGTTELEEDGDSDTYSVVLTTLPLGTVAITIHVDEQVSVQPPALFFSVSDWDTPQTVTTTAVDDEALEGPHVSTITHIAGGGGYESVSVPEVVANVSDNDANVIFEESDGSTDVQEGVITDTYTLVLGTAPLDTVFLAVQPDDQLSVAPSDLAFTTFNWDVPQAVVVTAIDDEELEGHHAAKITHFASGGGYDGVSVPSLFATVADNDATATVSESAGSTDVTESGPGDTYTIVLDTVPLDEATVSITAGPQIQVDPAVVTFTTSSWNVPQSVQVSAQDDAVVEGDHTSTITHSASGGGYDSAGIAAVVANVTDNDATVTISQSEQSTDVAEGGSSDTYTIVLDNPPRGIATVSLTPDAQVNVSPEELTFTGSTWSIPQSVTVTALDDSALEGSHVGGIAHSISGGGYDEAIVPAVEATIADNDSAAITVTESGGGTDVVEGGDSDSYAVVLDAQPSGRVTLTVTPDAQVSVSPATLTFTAADWDIPQIVTVTSLDDPALEGPHTGSISHSASGGGYRGAVLAAVEVAVVDNDSPAVTVIQSAAVTEVVEGGATDAYEVVLETKPSGAVTLSIKSDAQVSVSPASLTFTAADWNVPQTVTVTARSDSVSEGPHTGAITHSASGGGYEGAPISEVSVKIADGETFSIVVRVSDGATEVAEGGTIDTYEVVLNAQPSASVRFNVIPDAQVSVSPTTLIFDASTWNEPQTVTVIAVDDPTAEGAHTGTIQHVPEGRSADISVSALNVSVIDNDSFVPIGGSEGSGGTEGSEGPDGAIAPSVPEVGEGANGQADGSDDGGLSGLTLTLLIALGVLATGGAIAVVPILIRGR